jgi:protein subunit release factor A
LSSLGFRDAAPIARSGADIGQPVVVSGTADDQGDPLLDEVDIHVHVSTTEPRARVRLTHRPSGIEVESSSASTQVENRRLALAELRKRLGLGEV